MYEIIFKYHEIEDKENIKEKKIKIGAVDEEIPLEQVAGKIIAQYARKKINIIDVKIFEYTKKELHFKEENDSIKIGKRKFSFDEALISFEDNTGISEKDLLLEVIKNNPLIMEQLKTYCPSKAETEPVMWSMETEFKAPDKNISQLLADNAKADNIAGPQRYEIFDPMVAPDYPGCLELMKKKGWRFTNGKKYPIFQEKVASNNPLDGMLYSTVDDAGIRRDIKGFYFVPQSSGLTGSFMEDGKQYVGAASSEPVLLFDDVLNDEMPSLR
jgi:hypothetical protein